MNSKSESNARDYKSVIVLASSFWFVRGVIALVSVVALVPQFVDVSRFETLRAFHVILWQWREFLTFIGRLVGQIPFLPEISYETLSVVLVVINIIIPLVYSFFVARSKGEQENNLNFLDTDFGAIVLASVAILGASIDIFVLENQGLTGSPELAEPSEFGALRFLQLIMLAWVISVIFRNLPKYRSGVLFVFGFWLCAEVLYFIGSPILSEAVNGFVCELGDIPMDDC